VTRTALQSTADTYPDTLGPRRIKALYEVGEVAHEAAAEIETLRAALEARGLEIREKSDD